MGGTRARAILSAAGLAGLAAGACSVATTSMSTGRDLVDATPTDTPTVTSTPSHTPWATPAGSWIVVAGGETTGQTPVNQVHVAPILSNGAIGAWTLASAAIPTPVTSGGYWMTNGMWSAKTSGGYFVYGNPGGRVTTGYFFSGSGASTQVTGGSVGPWSPQFVQNATPVVVGGLLNGAVSDGSYVYFVNSFGLCTTGCLDLLLVTAGAFGSVNDGGPAIGASVSDAGLVQARGYLFSIGGTIGGSLSSAVYRAQVTAPGIVSTWASAASLVSPRGSGAGLTVSVEQNGSAYLYTLGGFVQGFGIVSSTYLASVDAAGNPTAWLTSNSLAAPVARGRAVVYRVAGTTYIAVVGGEPSLANPTSAVYYAAVGSSGSLGTWLSTTPLPSPRRWHAAEVF